jgi:hypothetical protein
MVCRWKIVRRWTAVVSPPMRGCRRVYQVECIAINW